MRCASERFQVLAAVLLDVRVVLNVDWSIGTDVSEDSVASIFSPRPVDAGPNSMTSHKT
jgi:hypothetical protein